MVLSEWEEHISSNGKIYWFNPQTNYSTFDKPQLPPGHEFNIKRTEVATPKQALPSIAEITTLFGSGWLAEIDSNSGKVYVYNLSTGQRKWWPSSLPSAASSPSTSAPSASSAAPSAPASLAAPKASSVPRTASPAIAKGPSGGWDAEDFLRRLGRARASGDRGQEKGVLKDVAEDNYKLVTNDPGSWKVPRTNLITTAECSKNINAFNFSVGADPRIIFSHRTTGEALLRLHVSNPKQKVCALNFANGVHIGGGYKNGAIAQEEDLCRQIPTLYTSLFNAKKWGNAYPFGPSTYKGSSPERYSDVLYTSNLLVARHTVSNGYGILPRSQMPFVSLVSAAAPNIRFAGEEHNKDLVQRCVDNIFIAPKLQEKDVSILVLGAWGCGAFGGDPLVMAGHFVTSLSKGMGKLYSEIHFAIPVFSDTDRNAEVFESVLSENGVRFVVDDSA